MSEGGVARGAGGRLGGWVDLARAGNFPSIASNVLAALVLSSVTPGEWPPASSFLLVLLAGWLAYAGGATLNDVVDAHFDARHRPERPIPRGLVGRGTAGLMGATQLIGGGALLLYLGAAMTAVLALIGVIVAYDLLHKRWRGSVVLMGGCRVLLAVAVATLPGQYGQMAFWLWLAGLFTYIVGLSLLARREYAPGAAAAVIGRRVGQLLALIPLVDALALALTGAWMPALACAAAFPVGRWAQRVAAAT